MDGGFRVTFLRCAQECAHAIVTIGVFGIVELIASQDISGKAAVFQTGIIVNPLAQEKFCPQRR
jgi:hypothetical protein